uniref:Uncharacterized protein n=1 Tax=Chromera velia CCMP2878 TaxID=1169474 RepID=A0A0G4IDQ5_9ALVE|eukprot:Cvel_2336.t1-p1 / transcript=Cvel_2336.t1 / gene=Cvel_2336 / organism=Chromera_velia_CCMP2878 / gene_product=hypothetical protein / transcript_product=hypothetical protein / location=Cvel_scaffold90:76263-89020(+) / protein_length=1016 / sequence_SO=supercontig / SO=protein_coding / is_pseudo=false
MTGEGSGPGKEKRQGDAERPDAPSLSLPLPLHGGVGIVESDREGSGRGGGGGSLNLALTAGEKRSHSILPPCDEMPLPSYGEGRAFPEFPAEESATTRGALEIEGAGEVQGPRREKRAVSLPSFPVSLAFLPSGDLAPLPLTTGCSPSPPGEAGGGFCSGSCSPSTPTSTHTGVTPFMDSLPNIGSLFHRPGRICGSRRCFWYLCRHCHFCEPNPVTAERKAARNKARNAARKERRRQVKAQAQQQTESQQRLQQNPPDLSVTPGLGFLGRRGRGQSLLSSSSISGDTGVFHGPNGPLRNVPNGKEFWGNLEAEKERDGEEEKEKERGISSDTSPFPIPFTPKQQTPLPTQLVLGPLLPDQAKGGSIWAPPPSAFPKLGASLPLPLPRGTSLSAHAGAASSLELEGLKESSHPVQQAEEKRERMWSTCEDMTEAPNTPPPEPDLYPCASTDTSGNSSGVTDTSGKYAREEGTTALLSAASSLPLLPPREPSRLSDILNRPVQGLGWEEGGGRPHNRGGGADNFLFLSLGRRKRSRSVPATVLSSCQTARLIPAVPRPRHQAAVTPARDLEPPPSLSASASAATDKQKKRGAGTKRDQQQGGEREKEEEGGKKGILRRETEGGGWNQGEKLTDSLQHRFCADAPSSVEGGRENAFFAPEFADGNMSQPFEFHLCPSSWAFSPPYSQKQRDRGRVGEQEENASPFSSVSPFFVHPPPPPPPPPPLCFPQCPPADGVPLSVHQQAHAWGKFQRHQQQQGGVGMMHASSSYNFPHASSLVGSGACGLMPPPPPPPDTNYNHIHGCGRATWSPEPVPSSYHHQAVPAFAAPPPPAPGGEIGNLRGGMADCGGTGSSGRRVPLQAGFPSFSFSLCHEAGWGGEREGCEGENERGLNRRVDAFERGRDEFDSCGPEGLPYASFSSSFSFRPSLPNSVSSPPSITSEREEAEEPVPPVEIYAVTSFYDYGLSAEEVRTHKQRLSEFLVTLYPSVKVVVYMTAKYVDLIRSVRDVTKMRVGEVLE